MRGGSVSAIDLRRLAGEDAFMPVREWYLNKPKPCEGCTQLKEALRQTSALAAKRADKIRNLLDQLARQGGV